MKAISLKPAPRIALSIFILVVCALGLFYGLTRPFPEVWMKPTVTFLGGAGFVIVLYNLVKYLWPQLNDLGKITVFMVLWFMGAIPIVEIITFMEVKDYTFFTIPGSPNTIAETVAVIYTAIGILVTTLRQKWITGRRS